MAYDVEYHRKYYQEHRAERLEYQRRYYKKHKETLREKHGGEKERKRNRERYKKHRERIAKRKREYYEKHRAEILAKQKEYCQQNPRKRRATWLAEWHVPLGEKCEICGSKDELERHHPDYDKPLEIITVCTSCHRRIHSPVLIPKSDLDPWSPPAQPLYTEG